ncbi:hypothetical protein ACHAWO_009402 [Cyclotella atomus]|uniref:TATA-box-binding protein n=1 Tax=Cyclotella atomus TaxID=382360 RepID=A0ABD3PCY7_9STRA
MASQQAAAADLSQHTPSLAGSVLECPDGNGGSLLIRIQNMACTANLGVRLDLKQIALRCRNTEFNPRRFAAVIMRLREPRATALLFASGRMVVTGCKNSHNCALAAKKFSFIVSKVGFQPSPLIDFKIQNVVGTVDVGFPIRLEGVVYAHPTFSSYEPELFPGLIYRLAQPRVVFLIFVSGKVVITGAKTEEQMVEGLKKVYPILCEFRKSETSSARPGDAPVIAGGAAAAQIAGVKGKRGPGRPRGSGKRGKELKSEDGNVVGV